MKPIVPMSPAAGGKMPAPSCCLVSQVFEQCQVFRHCCYCWWLVETSACWDSVVQQQQQKSQLYGHCAVGQTEMLLNGVWKARLLACESSPGGCLANNSTRYILPLSYYYKLGLTMILNIQLSRTQHQLFRVSQGSRKLCTAISLSQQSSILKK